MSRGWFRVSLFAVVLCATICSSRLSWRDGARPRSNATDRHVIDKVTQEVAQEGKSVWRDASSQWVHGEVGNVGLEDNEKADIGKVRDLMMSPESDFLFVTVRRMTCDGEGTAAL